MSIEVVSIGNELLTGHTINSNASTIGQLLLKQGFSVDRVTTLPDDREVLTRTITEALQRSQFVITTGGLGPTGDDLTREIVAHIFGVPIVHSQDVQEDLIHRFTAQLPTLQDQSLVPEGAQIMHNPIGTAPGFILTDTMRTLIVLPGVPSQMEALLEQVIPYLKKHSSVQRYVRSLYFCQLSEITVDPLLRELEATYPEVNIGICPGYGTLAVFIHAPNEAVLSAVETPLIEAFEPYFFSRNSKKIETAIHDWMLENGKTFACAESCSGGAMASRLTALSGASNYFLGSVVSYSNHVKNQVLHVSNETLQQYGAVSEETVREMVLGVRELTGADYAISISGVAGPHGGSLDKPVGTVWGAIATENQVFAGKFLAKGARKRGLVIDYSVTFLLSSLWRYLKHSHVPFT